MTVDEYMATLDWSWQRRLKLIFAKYDFHPTILVLIDPAPEPVTPKRNAPTGEITLWCNDNLKGKFHGWSDGIWFFDDPNDAMLFKLTWA